jgi:CRP/FNR family cyclic AMP-dependent transcriptional regulator
VRQRTRLTRRTSHNCRPARAGVALARALPCRPEPPGVIVRADAPGLLRRHAFFASLDNGALQQVAARLQKRSYKGGDMIFQRGDPGDAMFIVESGAVRLARDSAHGREFTVRLAGPGDIFGEIAIIDGAGRTTDAAAVAASVLFSLSRRDFQSVFRTSPPMQDAVLGALCERLRATTDQLEMIALQPLEARVAQLFLLLANVGEADERRRAGFELSIDQRELAALVGATRPRVNRVLVQWDQSGVIKRAGRRYDCDVEALRDIMAGGDDA